MFFQSNVCFVCFNWNLKQQKVYSISSNRTFYSWADSTIVTTVTCNTCQDKSSSCRRYFVYDKYKYAVRISWWLNIKCWWNMWRQEKSCLASLGEQIRGTERISQTILISADRQQRSTNVFQLPKQQQQKITGHCVTACCLFKSWWRIFSQKRTLNWSLFLSETS